MAEKIKEKLMTPHYFTGAVECEGAGGEVLRLVASLILYRKRVSNPTQDGIYGDISDISAVWWDFYCEDDEGIVFDDFDFVRFRSFLIEEE